jgi:hypothetical protein
MNAAEVKNIQNFDAVLNRPNYSSIPVSCNGTESSFANCNKLGEKNCAHYKDIYI